jgi:type II secretory ATPase GspE/PulE/Tfp pilus assembly ATPase PilB-like protein
VVGNTNGKITEQAVQSGGSDIFISSFDSEGHVRSVQQMGTTEDDKVN